MSMGDKSSTFRSLFLLLWSCLFILLLVFNNAGAAFSEYLGIISGICKNIKPC